jgi:cyclophilin family peptidyl-prolyl cis-trans isomerase
MKQKKTKAPIKNESANGLSNVAGTIAMARTNDPDSATAQFFINVADNSRLDKAGGGYCVFGKVVEGMDVVNKIKEVKTATKTQKVEINGQLIDVKHGDVPVDDVVIKSIKKAP